MRGAGLDGLAILDHGFDGVGVQCAGEAFGFGLFACDNRDGEVIR